MNPTVNDLIPEEQQSRILSVRGAGDAEFWIIGDVAVELEDDADGNQEKVRAIRNAIADLAGVTARTVQEYKSNAAYYPKAVRELFPNLTRWHFRFAKRARELEKSAEWLVLAANSADDYGGKPMPVDVLAAKMDGLRPPSVADAIERVAGRLMTLYDRCETDGAKKYLLSAAPPGQPAAPTTARA